MEGSDRAFLHNTGLPDLEFGVSAEPVCFGALSLCYWIWVADPLGETMGGACWAAAIHPREASYHRDCLEKPGRRFSALIRNVPFWLSHEQKTINQPQRRDLKPRGHNEQWEDESVWKKSGNKKCTEPSNLPQRGDTKAHSKNPTTLSVHCLASSALNQSVYAIHGLSYAVP